MTDALLQILQIELERRDYYKAHHTISRSKHLDVEPVEEIGLYELFVEGVITMMKKKYKEALQLLLKAAQHKNVHKLNLAGLINKYLGYGYFKEG